MSEKQGPPPSHLAGHTVGYGLMPTAPQNPPPPSYLESLNHQVVAGAAGIPPQYQYMTQAAASQMQKDKDAATMAYAQNLAAAHQAQKLAYSQQMAYQQQQNALYMQQQQQLYSQQLRQYYPQAGLQPGQNVMVLDKDAATMAYAQNLAAAHQAQKLAYSQQMAYQQQQQSKDQGHY